MIVLAKKHSHSLYIGRKKMEGAKRKREKKTLFFMLFTIVTVTQWNAKLPFLQMRFVKKIA